MGKGTAAAQMLGGAAPLAVAMIALATARSDGSVPGAEAPPIAAPISAPAAAPPAPGAAVAVPAATGAADQAPAPADRATPECRARFALDLPKHRGDDVARRQVLICRRGYILSFNVDTRSPDWVMERLTRAELQGTASRGNRFLHDPLLPEGADADNPDYLKTGFDRGHQAPAGDAKFDQRIMDESFYFTNMSPQRGIGMNRGAWKFLEETTRGWVLCGEQPELYVITGPIYGTLPGNPPTIGDPPVAVPRAYFKILYNPVTGRALGFVLENKKIGSRITLEDYVVPIAEIETETGLNFFRSFEQRRQAQLKDNKAVVWGHTGTCPGDTGGD